MNFGEWSDCVRMMRKADRRMMILRGSTAGFQIETGRWREVTRQETICKECDSGEVEDVEHWLMRCEAWKSQRVQLEAGCNDIATGAVPRIQLHLCCWLHVTTMNSCQLLCVCGMQGSVNPILHVHNIHLCFAVSAAWGQSAPSANGHSAL